MSTPPPTVLPTHADVVVVGARCAGATVAMLLARAGHDVLLVDRAEFPSDTLSTHAIARSGVVQLRRFGLLDALFATGAPAIREVEFHDGTDVVRRRFKDRHGVDALVAPRRTELDALLVDAARAAGARVATGVTVCDVRRAPGGRVAGVVARTDAGTVEVDARFVVGADGLRSRVARSVGAAIVEQHPSPSAAHYTYVPGDWGPIEYHLGDGAFAGIFPTHAGEACVWTCTRDTDALAARRGGDDLGAAFDRLIARLTPTLADRLRGHRRSAPVRGIVNPPNQVRQGVGSGWALVGDAAYHRDPVTGHGISDAFRDADHLAAALDVALRGEVDEVEALCGYERGRLAMLRPLLDVTRQMSLYPDASRVRELQVRLSDLIEAESAMLVERPALDVVAR